MMGMWKSLIFFLLVIAALLSSCGAQKKDIYDVDFQNGSFTVDTIKKTITYDGQLYKYEKDDTTITIIYPDKVKYWWTVIESGGYGGYAGLNGDYDKEKYVSGDLLMSVLSSEVPKIPRHNKNYILITVFLVVGAWGVISPYSTWYVRYGWRYKNAEPSEESITITRIGGFIIISIGVILIFL